MPPAARSRSGWPPPWNKCADGTRPQARARKDGSLREIWLREGGIAGFRLTGDVSGAGIYRCLIHRGADASAYEHRLLDPGFGPGYVENLAASCLARIEASLVV